MLALGCRAPAAPVVQVAAAADLARAFEEVGRGFEAQGGPHVRFTFGSTGLLARQVEQGAPFDVFAAANQSFVDDVVKAGACDPSTQALYARGRIALWSKAGRVEPPLVPADLAHPRFTRIAIANPDHAPYGRAAREAFEAVGAWAAVQPRLVFGENVRQTLQFAQTGNVDAAVVALSLIVDDTQNPWRLVEESLHQPLDQALVVCSRGPNRAGGEAFVRYLGSEAGRKVMRRYGFLLPGESLERGE
jgi:molybdate transport system substrate-binding protein